MKAEEEKLIAAMARTIDSYAFVVPHGAGPYLTEYKKSFQRAARRDARRALSAIRAAGYCVMPEEPSESADLLFQTYLGMLVLQTILKKQNLRLGAERTKEILNDIEAAHPEFAARSALRDAGKGE